MGLQHTLQRGRNRGLELLAERWEFQKCAKTHTFRFDEDKAYEDQVVSILEASPEHPLSVAGAPRQSGVFVIFRSGVPLYVGKTKDLRSRLKDHLRRTAKRKGTNLREITCRFL